MILHKEIWRKERKKFLNTGLFVCCSIDSLLLLRLFKKLPKPAANRLWQPLNKSVY
jgi:hypothetical protein